MKHRQTLRLLRQSFRIAGVNKILYIYLAFFCVTAVVLYLVDPNINSFGDSLWYCFAVATTVKFGDIAALSVAGRILTVILSIYSLGVVAIVTAVLTSFFMDVAKARAKNSAGKFIDDLQRLPELSKEELTAPYNPFLRLLFSLCFFRNFLCKHLVCLQSFQEFF